MKILRIRRGYTTNSSAYTEWLPPPAGGSAQSNGAPATGTASGGSGPGGASAPVVSGTQAPSAMGSTQTQPPSQLGGNSLLVGGLLAAVVAVFVGERLVRRLRLGRHRVGDADE